MAVLTMPTTTVRSVGRTAAARKACLGAWSMLFVVERKIGIAVAVIKLLGRGIGASVIDAGIWVKTMVLIKPMRWAMEEATRFKANDKMLVAKKKRTQTAFLRTELAVEVCHLGRWCRLDVMLLIVKTRQSFENKRL